MNEAADRSSDVVVVGAGVVGSAVAYRLAQSGASVTIVDRAFPGSGTSGATFSWLNSYNKQPPAYHRLNVMGMSEHRVLAEHFGSQDVVHFDGGMVWETDPEILRDVQQRVTVTRKLGYLVEELTPRDANRLEPDLLIDAATPVVYRMATEGWADTLGLAHRLCSLAASRYGARVVLGQRVEVKTTGGKATGVVLEDGSAINCGLVVNACGPEAGAFAATAGAKIPIERHIGISFVTGSVPTGLKHVVHAPGVSLRPDSATRVMIRVEGLDSTVEEGEVVDAADARCDKALKKACEVMPSLQYGRIESARIGVRPIPSDGLPAVGPDPIVENLYHCVTHSGATLAAVLGRLVYEDIALGDARELEPFRPSRFLSPTLGPT